MVLRASTTAVKDSNIHLHSVAHILPPWLEHRRVLQSLERLGIDIMYSKAPNIIELHDMLSYYASLELRGTMCRHHLTSSRVDIPSRVFAVVTSPRFFSSHTIPENKAMPPSHFIFSRFAQPRLSHRGLGMRHFRNSRHPVDRSITGSSSRVFVVLRLHYNWWQCTVLCPLTFFNPIQSSLPLPICMTIPQIPASNCEPCEWYRKNPEDPESIRQSIGIAILGATA